MAKVYMVQNNDGWNVWLCEEAGAFLDRDEAERAAKAISPHADVVELELHVPDAQAPLATTLSAYQLLSGAGTLKP